MTYAVDDLSQHLHEVRQERDRVLRERQALAQEWAFAGLIEITKELDRTSGCDYITAYKVAGKKWYATWARNLDDDELFTNIALGVQAQGG